MLEPGTLATHPDFRGIALVYLGPQTEPGESEWWDDDAQEYVYDEEPEPVETGLTLVRMVGDDATHAVDPDGLAAIPDDDAEHVCSCGQLGCGWGG